MGKRQNSKENGEHEVVGKEDHVVSKAEGRALHACGGHILLGPQVWTTPRSGLLAGVEHTVHTNRHLSTCCRPKVFTNKKI